MSEKKFNQIDPQMFVEQVLNMHPQTARVFVDKQMACVGCPMAAFETLEEVAINYGKDVKTFLEALESCSLEPKKSGGAK